MKFILVLLVALNVAVLINGQTAIKAECFPPPNQKNPRECCAAPGIVPSREEFTSCAQNFPKPTGPPTPGSPPHGHNCIAECMLQKQGILAGGAFNKDAATARLVALIGSSADWQKVAAAAVNACYTTISSQLAQKDELGCSAAAGAFVECMPTEMFKNCPAAAWTSSAECNAQKAHLAKGCPITTLMGRPPHP